MTPDRSGDPPDPGDRSDEQLLADFLSGRRRDRAFHELVDRYQRRVYAICYRYFGQAADAEDATQEAFLTIARRAETFGGRSALSTWIYRITVNTCHDLARKRARRPQSPVADVVGLVDGAGSHPSIGWDPGDPAVATQTAEAVQRALLELDPTSRALVVLVAIEGVPYAEAAAAVDMPIGTAKSRVHRARARLAELLADLDPDAPDEQASARATRTPGNPQAASDVAPNTDQGSPEPGTPGPDRDHEPPGEEGSRGDR